VVLIIPHPNNQKKMQGYNQKIQAFVAQLIAQGKRIALKYHPREQGDDALGLANTEQVILIPTTLAFEFVLSLLPKSATVIGDVGTVLFTAKWLRDVLDIVATLSEEDTFQKRFIAITKKFEINIKSLESLGLED